MLVVAAPARAGQTGHISQSRTITKAGAVRKWEPPVSRRFSTAATSSAGLASLTGASWSSPVGGGFGRRKCRPRPRCSARRLASGFRSFSSGPIRSAKAGRDVTGLAATGCDYGGTRLLRPFLRFSPIGQGEPRFRSPAVQPWPTRVTGPCRLPPSDPIPKWRKQPAAMRSAANFLHRWPGDCRSILLGGGTCPGSRSVSSAVCRVIAGEWHSLCCAAWGRDACQCLGAQAPMATRSGLPLGAGQAARKSTATRAGKMPIV